MLEKLNGVANVFDSRRLGAGFQPNPLAAAHDDSRIFPFTATPSRARAFPSETAVSTALHSRHNKAAPVLPGSRDLPYAPAGRYADGTTLM
jgi:hypothetical protein